MCPDRRQLPEEGRGREDREEPPRECGDNFNRWASAYTPSEGYRHRGSPGWIPAFRIKFQL